MFLNKNLEIQENLLKYIKLRNAFFQIVLNCS